MTRRSAPKGASSLLWVPASGRSAGDAIEEPQNARQRPVKVRQLRWKEDPGGGAKSHHEAPERICHEETLSSAATPNRRHTSYSRLATRAKSASARSSRSMRACSSRSMRDSTSLGTDSAASRRCAITIRSLQAAS